jgi:hypothetical protein
VLAIDELPGRHDRSRVEYPIHGDRGAFGEVDPAGVTLAHPITDRGCLSVVMCRDVRMADSPGNNADTLRQRQ